MLDRASGRHLIERALLLIECPHISDDKAGAHQRLLDGVPDRVLRVVKLHSHPAARFEDTVELAKARFHEVLVLLQALVLGLVHHRLGLIVGEHAQPGFPKEVQFRVHEVGAKRRINEHVIH